ncbi:unnamed protein product, partial [Prorocentrum cordatum]
MARSEFCQLHVEGGGTLLAVASSSAPPSARDPPEVAAVMASAGVVEPASLAQTTAELVAFSVEVARRTAENYSSMLQDVLRGRRTEVESMNGYVAARAAELGVPVPATRQLLGLVRLLERHGVPATGGASPPAADQRCGTAGAG